MSNLYIYNGIDWEEIGKDGSDANINTDDFRKKEDKLLISEVKELPEVIATLQNRTQLLNQIASQRTSAEKLLSTLDVSKTFTYNGDGTLNTLSSSIGTKTMSYTDGLLVRIYGSGGYKGKTLTYNGSGQLIASTIS